jgi:hypothetical protein
MQNVGAVARRPDYEIGGNCKLPPPNKDQAEQDAARKSTCYIYRPILLLHETLRLRTQL